MHCNSGEVDNAMQLKAKVVRTGITSQESYKHFSIRAPRAEPQCRSWYLLARRIPASQDDRWSLLDSSQYTQFALEHEA
jgi:hypothetical protein